MAASKPVREEPLAAFARSGNHRGRCFAPGRSHAKARGAPAAAVGVDRIEDEPALNSFFENRANADAASAGVMKRLASLEEGTKAALVTHQVNLTALTDVFPSSGEMVVVSIGGDGELDVRGRIRLE